MLRTRKFPLTLVLNSNDEMEIDTRETFGPILMVKTYQKPEEVVDYIVQRDRPLAFYPFSNNKSLSRILYQPSYVGAGFRSMMPYFMSGSMTYPFGGVGASGMGHYHGYEGFLTFSKMRPVFIRRVFRV